MAEALVRCPRCGRGLGTLQPDGTLAVLHAGRRLLAVLSTCVTDKRHGGPCGYVWRAADPPAPRHAIAA